MNKLIITGRLTRDAEVRYIKSGTAVMSFSVATNTGYGENQKTHYFDCSLFGKRADGRLQEFMLKGTQVLVEGEVSLNTYQKNDGSSGASLNVFVQNVELMGGQSQPAAQNSPRQAPQGQGNRQTVPPPDDEWDPDIPF